MHIALYANEHGEKVVLYNMRNKITQCRYIIVNIYKIMYLFFHHQKLLKMNNKLFNYYNIHLAGI